MYTGCGRYGKGGFHTRIDESGTFAILVMAVIHREKGNEEVWLHYKVTEYVLCSPCGGEFWS